MLMHLDSGKVIVIEVLGSDKPPTDHLHYILLSAGVAQRGYIQEQMKHSTHLQIS